MFFSKRRKTKKSYYQTIQSPGRVYNLNVQDDFKPFTPLFLYHEDTNILMGGYSDTILKKAN